MNFHPPFSEPPSFFFSFLSSNIEVIFDFSDIITKIHPPFQNPGSALVAVKSCVELLHSCEINYSGCVSTSLHSV